METTGMRIEDQCWEELAVAWVLATCVAEATVGAGRTDPAEMVRWAEAERAKGVALPHLEGEAVYTSLGCPID